MRSLAPLFSTACTAEVVDLHGLALCEVVADVRRRRTSTCALVSSGTWILCGHFAAGLASTMRLDHPARRHPRQHHPRENAAGVAIRCHRLRHHRLQQRRAIAPTAAGRGSPASRGSCSTKRNTMWRVRSSASKLVGLVGVLGVPHRFGDRQHRVAQRARCRQRRAGGRWWSCADWPGTMAGMASSELVAEQLEVAPVEIARRRRSGPGHSSPGNRRDANC